MSAYVIVHDPYLPDDVMRKYNGRSVQGVASRVAVRGRYHLYDASYMLLRVFVRVRVHVFMCVCVSVYLCGKLCAYMYVCSCLSTVAGAKRDGPSPG